jgi:hypothetical protein
MCNRSCLYLVALSLSLLALTGGTVRAQEASTLQEKLPLKAALVLTPDFCKSKLSHNDRENAKAGIEVGKIACGEFEPALKDVFATLTTISDLKDVGGAQVILTPRFVDLGARMEGITSFANYDLYVFLEWTAKDASGKTIWLDTVEGSARHQVGNLFTARKNGRIIAHDAVKDLAARSASRISSSAELRKFSR